MNLSLIFISMGSLNASKPVSYPLEILIDIFDVFGSQHGHINEVPVVGTQGQILEAQVSIPLVNHRKLVFNTNAKASLLVLPGL